MRTLACTLLLLTIICLASATLTTRSSALQGIETVRQAPLAIGQPIATILSEMLATRPTDSEGQWLYTPNDAGSQWCTKNSYFELIPVHLGTVLANGSPASWKAPCFATTSATFVQHGSTSATIQIAASNPVTQDCADLYVFSTSYANYWIEVAVHNSNRKLEIPSFKGNELLDIQQNGVRALQLPCGLGGSIESAIKTISLFVPGDAQEPNMIKFLVKRKIFPPFQPFNKTQPLDKKLIKSGTYLSILGMDGLSALIMFGTGGRTSHSAVAVWDGPELYVCESTAMDPTSRHPWPAPWGIIRTPWDTWLQYATGMEYIINLLPLQSQYQAQFNEQRFWSWFRTVQGQPYGYHTFLFSFIDTPAKNLPLPMDESVTGWLLTTMDRLLPNSTGEISVYSLITWGLNHRIKKDCPDVTCVSDTLLSQKMNLAQLLSQPEDDSWRYGPNVSLVCSEFAASVYKYALGPNWPSPFQATEQTPKDNYQMNIFDGSYWNSQNCPIGLSRDPTGNGTYCQIMGKWVLPLNGYNTVPIYPNMNNNCPAQWPDYTRCPAGNPKCC